MNEMLKKSCIYILLSTHTGMDIAGANCFTTALYFRLLLELCSILILDALPDKLLCFGANRTLGISLRVLHD